MAWAHNYYTLLDKIYKISKYYISEIAILSLNASSNMENGGKD